jgi:hypothetical protein
MHAMEGDGDRPLADNVFGFIWQMEGRHGIARLRRTIAGAALLQASQQQITDAANIGLAARQRALASIGQANKIYSFRREVLALRRKRC